jgi:hypothetical protein
VRPATAEDVSLALTTLVEGACKFAVRGGGHGSVKGISNIEEGVTIDMRGLDDTTVNADGTLVTIGAGQVWGGAYTITHEAGVTIPGGRVSGIGVAGSTMGSALGYIAQKSGFGADNVVEFEVVLANGTIVTATKHSNSDLWRSLKGGGSNFGIITKLVMSTTPIGDIWTSSSAYDVSAIHEEIRAFSSFTANPNYDTNANLLMTYHYTAAGGSQIANLYTYAAPVEKPAAYSQFYPIQGQLGNVSDVTNIPDYSVNQDATSPDGLQQITFATTFKNSVRQLEEVWTIFNGSLSSIAAIEGVSWSLTLEPIPTTLAAATRARGGNVMGVDVPPEGLVVVLGSFTFTSADDFPTMDSLTEKLLNDIIAAAKKNRVFNSFIDLNHAKGSQNPFKGYGAKNYALLKATAKKYDPDGVFQTLMPGGFKL